MNVLIYINFKLFVTFKINSVHAIIFNYFVCVIAGTFFIEDFEVFTNAGIDWIFIGIGLGIIFIINFNLISKTTVKYGISVSSIATKLSLVIPVLVSLFFLQTQYKEFNFLNYAGVFLAIPAIILGSIKKQEKKVNSIKSLGLILPFLTFLLSGTIDTTINVTNFYFLENRTESAFIMVVFGCAALIGLVYFIVKGEKVELKNILAAITLGVSNYLALYFLIKTLSAMDNDGSIVYPSVNISVIILASFISWAFFKDKISTLNKMGILLSILSILLLYHGEILAYF